MPGIFVLKCIAQSVNKLEPPTRKLICLGIEFDLEAHCIRIPPEKLQEITDLCALWSNKSSATRRQLQSLLGKLLYISKCVRPARLFVNRMLQTLKQSPPSGRVPLSPAFHKDLQWSNTTLPSFNGVVLFPQVHTHDP